MNKELTIKFNRELAELIANRTNAKTTKAVDKVVTETATSEDHDRFMDVVRFYGALEAKDVAIKSNDAVETIEEEVIEDIDIPQFAFSRPVREERVELPKFSFIKSYNEVYK